jgi:hypothetical protein
LQEVVARAVLDKVLLGLPQLAVAREQPAVRQPEIAERLTQAVAEAVGHQQTHPQLQVAMVVQVLSYFVIQQHGQLQLVVV